MDGIFYRGSYYYISQNAYGCQDKTLFSPKMLALKYSMMYNRDMTERITATTKATVIAASFVMTIRGGKAKQ